MSANIRERIAKRIAKELKDGDYVNLGIGLPTVATTDTIETAFSVGLSVMLWPATACGEHQPGHECAGAAFARDVRDDLAELRSSPGAVATP